MLGSDKDLIDRVPPISDWRKSLDALVRALENGNHGVAPDTSHTSPPDPPPKTGNGIKMATRAWGKYPDLCPKCGEPAYKYEAAGDRPAIYDCSNMKCS